MDLNINKEIESWIEKSTSLEYLNVINPKSIDAFVDFQQRLAPLGSFIFNGANILSIGIRRGLELEAVKEIANQRNIEVNLFGLDLSNNSIKETSSYLESKGIKASLLKGNATCLKSLLENKKMDIIILSSVLHEIFSYSISSKENWIKTLTESISILNDNGIIYIRDFAAPNSLEDVQLTLKSKESQDFFDLFCLNFATISNKNNLFRQQVIKKLNLNGYLYLKLNPWLAAEFSIHFRNFKNDLRYGLINSKKISSWKEINEIYFIPHPFSNIKIELLTSNKYAECVMDIARATETQSVFEIVFLATIPKQKTKIFLEEHLDDHKSGFLSEVSSKVEFIIQKNFI